MPPAHYSPILGPGGIHSYPSNRGFRRFSRDQYQEGMQDIERQRQLDESVGALSSGIDARMAHIDSMERRRLAAEAMQRFNEGQAASRPGIGDLLWSLLDPDVRKNWAAGPPMHPMSPTQPEASVPGPGLQEDTLPAELAADAMTPGVPLGTGKLAAKGLIGSIPFMALDAQARKAVTPMYDMLKNLVEEAVTTGGRSYREGMDLLNRNLPYGETNTWLGRKPSYQERLQASRDYPGEIDTLRQPGTAAQLRRQPASEETAAAALPDDPNIITGPDQLWVDYAGPADPELAKKVVNIDDPDVRRAATHEMLEELKVPEDMPPGQLPNMTQRERLRDQIPFVGKHMPMGSDRHIRPHLIPEALADIITNAVSPVVSRAGRAAEEMVPKIHEEDIRALLTKAAAWAKPKGPIGAGVSTRLDDAARSMVYGEPGADWLEKQGKSVAEGVGRVGRNLEEVGALKKDARWYNKADTRRRDVYASAAPPGESGDQYWQKNLLKNVYQYPNSGDIVPYLQAIGALATAGGVAAIPRTMDSHWREVNEDQLGQSDSNIVAILDWLNTRQGDPQERPLRGGGTETVRPQEMYDLWKMIRDYYIPPGSGREPRPNIDYDAQLHPGGPPPRPGLLELMRGG